MEEKVLPTADKVSYLIPEVADILDIQVTGQNLLVKPTEITLTRTSGGIILGGGEETDKLRSMMLQRGVVVNKGSKVSEDIKVGSTVFFFKASVGGRMIRQDTDIYVMLGDYDVHAYLKK